MLIAQISDCHVVASGKLFDRVDTPAYLRQAVQALNALPVRPDLVLATGDLTENGRPDEYEVFLEIMADLRCPVLPLAGNHDHRGALIKAFDLPSRVGLHDEFVQYSWDAGPLRILALDSSEPGRSSGLFCARRAGWVREQLARDQRPVLIAMHHPPFDAGVPWLENPDPKWARVLAEIIGSSRSVARVMCGHVHRAISTDWAGVMAMTAPSTAHQVLLDLSPSGPPRLNLEAPGFLLHEWRNGHLRTFGVSTSGILDVIAR